MLVLHAENLRSSVGIAHGFFGRSGGVSSGIYASLNCGPGSNDSRPNVIENRRQVAQSLAPDAALVTLGQLHGTGVMKVEKPWPIGEVAQDDRLYIPLGDAMVTIQSGIALGILAADCAPVLFADVDARVIGAAHAGWKGALAGVTDSALAAMEALGAERAQITAAIGPCISQANYEVGAELRERFTSVDPANARFFITSDRAAHFRFDLESYVAHRLGAAGIGSVERLSTCTYARESDFFSYRRATHRGEADYGRQISAILLCK